MRAIRRAVCLRMRGTTCLSRHGVRGLHSLRYTPHAFDKQLAALRFYNANLHPLLGPLLMVDAAQPTRSLLLSTRDPLQPFLVPFYCIHATVASTRYSGCYHVPRQRAASRTVTDSKGQRRVEQYTEEWNDTYPANGILTGVTYSPAANGMKIYGGLRWPATTIETVVNGHNLSNTLPFNTRSIDAAIQIDEFKKRIAVAHRIAKTRIDVSEQSRALEDIRRRTGYDGAVHSIVSDYQYSIEQVMLPFYVLQHEPFPARFLSAISTHDKSVVGPQRYSPIKLATIGSIVSSVLACAFPEVVLPVKIAAVAFSAVASGAWAHWFGGAWHQRLIEHRLQEDEAENDAAPETDADRQRLAATQRVTRSNNTSNGAPAVTRHEYNDEFYESLGLDRTQPITSEMVDAAFAARIKQAHPDHGGSTEQTQAVLRARAMFYTQRAAEPK